MPILGIAVVGNGLSNDHRDYLAAGGYGFFDAAALALAPRIDTVLSGYGRRRRERAEHGVVEQPVAAHHAAAVGSVDA